MFKIFAGGYLEEKVRKSDRQVDLTGLVTRLGVSFPVVFSMTGQPILLLSPVKVKVLNRIMETT